MSKSTHATCTICTQAPAEAEVIFRRENRGIDQPWVHVETRAAHPVCPACRQWIAKVLHSAASPSEGFRGLGFPADARGPRRATPAIAAEIRDPESEIAVPGGVDDASPAGLAIRLGWLPHLAGNEADVRLEMDRFTVPIRCSLVGSHQDGGQVVAHFAYAELGPEQERLIGGLLAMGGATADRGHQTDNNANDRCDFCSTPLGDEAHAVDVMPIGGQQGRRFGTVRQHRLCVACWSWGRSLLFDDAAARGTSYRQNEGGSGSWLAPAAFDAAGAFLLPDDEHVLRQAVESMGRWCSTLGPVAARQFAGRPHEVLFLAANANNGATELLGKLTQEATARTVVVGKIDAIRDVGSALAAGAADFLASPLSPHQVAGAFERLAQPDRLEGRNAETGLPIYRRTPGVYADPCHVVNVTTPPSEDQRTVAWLLRRFLRGYDRVGASADTGLEAFIYCPDASLPRVLERLRTLLGAHAKIAPVDRIESGSVTAERLPRAA